MDIFSLLGNLQAELREIAVKPECGTVVDAAVMGVGIAVGNRQRMYAAEGKERL